ncbi:hemolysin family protein [Micrococcus endophyticus]|uniref:hemolysin family protein n=1 Tax=Micrococcus endophyticus TaxID=455343 RepID=UPI002006094F|nr:hemolysin family protein [Micrococcus endophyticus]
MDPILLLILGTVVILVIILANGFFVAQEFAYMSVDRVRLAAAAENGDEAARRALAVTRRTSFMLSGAQLGITVTGLLVGYVAEPMVGEALTQLLGGTAIPASVVIAVSTVGVLLVATVVQMIIGELYPKNLAIANPDPLARALARPTQVYLALFGWLIWVFDKSAEALLLLLRIEPVHDVDSTATAQDLDRIVEDSRDSGTLPAELSVLLDRILDFPERDAEHAMVPRSQTDEVGPETTVAEVRALMAAAHTRYPVISADHQPLGVVHLQDVLALGHAPAPDLLVTDVMRPATVVPTVMPLPDVTRALDDADDQLACVIDEHGGFVGVLTLEDLAEELVGDLRDEHDDEAHEEIVPVVVGESWALRGDVHLDELERAIGHPLPEGEAETVSGLLIESLGRLPEEGERVAVDLPEDTRDYGGDVLYGRRLEVDVRRVERHVPADVEVHLVETPREDETEEDPR